MKKTHKAVLSTLAVLCLLFMGSGVAQAQRCVARAISPGMVRAEGITEVVADIELRCAPPESGTFGFNQVPLRIDIAVELNARITNLISTTGRFEGFGYESLALTCLTMELSLCHKRRPSATPTSLLTKSRGIALTGTELTGTDGDLGTTAIFDEVFMGIDDAGVAVDGGGKLSADSTTIVWKNIATGEGVDVDGFDVPDQNLNLDAAGFSLVIAGLRVNAASVGDGGDITAVVMVKGSAVGNPIEVAGVATGLAIKVKTTASGLQCADSDADAEATITIQEGFKAGIMSGVQARDAVEDDPDTLNVNEMMEAILGVGFEDVDTVLVSFTGIPEGVSVMVPDAVGLAPQDNDTSADEVKESFRLVLMDTGRDTGIDGKVVDNKATVMLSEAGGGSVVYYIFDASDTVDANEWANLKVMFKWTAEGDMPPAIGSSYVNVSFNPVSAIGGDTFDDNGSKVPRFIATSGDPIMVLKIGDCTTTLLFPFVTNTAPYDTGLAISNTSEETGSCTLTYSGSNAPEGSQTTQAIAGGAQWIRLSSMIAPGFQGYLTAACGFRDAHGFAFLSNGYPGGPVSAAQGYLAVCTAGTSCGHPVN